ncbi:MAG: prolipoprotein diacylglyceryl transferase [Breznakia sp.]
MQFFPNTKTFLELNLFGLELHIQWYAICIMGGALLAYYLSLRNAKKMGYGKALLEDYFLYLLPLVIVGARVWYVLFAWDMYDNDLFRMINITEGGLAIHGGIIVGIIFSYFYFRKKGVNVLRIGDCILVNLLLAQAIGRWGNFINQEAYGRIVSEDYFNGFPLFIKEHMFIDGAYRQPMFLFEGIGNVIGFLFITFVFKKFYKKRKRGDLVFAYVFWYGMVRFVVEIYRSDALMLGSLKIAQLTSIAFMAIGLLGIGSVFHKMFKNVYPFKREKPVILFDMDGTLLDSVSLILDSFKWIFSKYKPTYELTEVELRKFMGPPLEVTFAKHFPDRTDEMIEAYRTYNRMHHDAYVKPMSHAIELLEYLQAEGYEMAIVSNKRRDMVMRGLEVSGLAPYFSIIVAGDDVEHHKPNPEGLLKACEQLCVSHDDLIYVGDAIADVKAAKNIGAYSIVYVNNEMMRDTLIKEKPNRVITDLLEIKDILQETNTMWETMV